MIESFGRFGSAAAVVNCAIALQPFRLHTVAGGCRTRDDEYRLDFTAATNHTECAVGLVLNFGPVTKLTYPQNQPAQVYVVTQGGLGSVGIQSAEQDGDVITFTFKSYLCAGTSTYFFGLAAAKGPQSATATLFEFGSPPFIQLNARTPAH
jgi:hypothetical protein